MRVLAFIALLFLSASACAVPLRGGVANLGNIGNSDFVAKTIFQRAAGGTSKTVSFSGTWAGTTPSSVEVQVLNSSSLSVAQGWTALSSLSTTGGSYSGNLSVPQGGWYFWQSRGKDSSGNVLYTSAVTGNKFGVGILVSCIGQSNMWNSFLFTSGSPPTPSDLTVQYQGTFNVGGGFNSYLIPPTLDA